MMTGNKWASKLNSAIGIVTVHFKMVKVVIRVGIYSSKAAASSVLGKTLAPSIKSIIITVG